MTGDYVDPILSRSPYSSPARGGAYDSHNRTGGVFEGGSSSRYASGTTSHASPSRERDSFGVGPSSPRGAGLTSRTSIESPVGVYRTSRLQELEDSREQEKDEEMQMDVDSGASSKGDEESMSSRRINSNQQAEAPGFDDDAPPRGNTYSSSAVSPSKPRPLPSTTPASASASTSYSNSFRGSPLKHSLPTTIPDEAPPSPSSSRPPRPVSPTSSIGTSAASSSDNHSIGVGFKSNLGLLNSSGPDLCRRCQKAVYFAEQVMAGGHK